MKIPLKDYLEFICPWCQKPVGVGVATRHNEPSYVLVHADSVCKRFKACKAPGEIIPEKLFERFLRMKSPI